ncbi:hypothetical protein BDR26DRAFT_937696 [Obelidium mucronatum]|nr:hypothetical protein BDR26DRAFT_937696 [Obelidium mucronatum]
MLPWALPTLAAVTTIAHALKTIALITSQASIEYISADPFNLLAETGCSKAVSEAAGFNCKWIAAAQASYSGTALDWFITQLSNDKSIIHAYLMGFYFGDLILPLATRFPNITFSINDSGVDPNSARNIQGILFSEDEAGFLAGVGAGSITTTNIVSVIGNYPVPPIQRYIQGFLKGVKYVNPHCKVLGTYNADPTWRNRTLGESIAQFFLDQDADVIFNSAGALGSSAILYAARNGKWAIGVDSDEAVTLFPNKSDPAAEWIFNSALKKVDIATYNVVRDKIQGVFFNGNKHMDISNGGIGVTNCSSTSACKIASSLITFLDPKTSSGSCSTPMKISISNLISMTSMRLQVNAFSTQLTTGFYQGFQQTSYNSWVNIPSFGITPGGLQGHSMTLISDNRFLIYGGQKSSGEYSSSLYLFRVDTAQWTLLKPGGSAQPPPLVNHAAVFSSTLQHLVIFGGSSSIATLNNNVWKYLYKTNVWVQVVVNPSISGPGHRTLQAYAFMSEYLYVWGGQDETGNIQGDFWRFDTISNTWDQLPTPSTGNLGISYPQGKYGSAMASVNGTTLLLFGGNDGNQDFNDLWSFNVNLKLWARLSPNSKSIVHSVTNPAAVVLDSRRVLFVGGISNKIPQSAGFIYNSGTNAWTGDLTLNLPIATQGLSVLALNQSSDPNACVFELDSRYSECISISNEVMVFTYGGAQPLTGISDTLMVMFAANEVMPPPPMQIPLGISITGYTISGVGICFVAGMAVVLFMNAKRPAFRFASVAFLSLYLLGAGFGFLGIIFYNIGEAMVPMCTASLWFVSIGCMLIYSAMVVKNGAVLVILL